ncbi:putative MFS peptide transporter [Teratosphaeria nubilosa]|uniref:Putative MFS peptide transporter n=1 Tax=Teratosphaeria nubilosa TaxID=161662 RepID=A0A6G1L2G1_9PEZI|nr:putative MFS peptide transporter [Teratosphaeria nubilosa]
MALHGEILTDVIATNVPAEVAHPHGKNSFALEDGRATVDKDFAKRMSVDVEAVGERTSSVIERENYPVPTTEELSTLRRVADDIPTVAWLLCLVEFAERASYYGVQTVFSNFMQFPLPAGGNGAGATPKGSQETAGALGLGLTTANAMYLLFVFLAYVVPIAGGWIADVRVGRFNVILWGVLLCGISHIVILRIMICGAIPSVLQAGHGAGPFFVSLFLLAIGAGLFKPNVAPTLLDQYKHQKVYTKVLKSGEKVVVDPESTIQRIMLYFYALINVGAFFAVATTYTEKYIGYWLSYLLPGILYFLLPALLWYLNSRIVKYPPEGTVLTKAWKILYISAKRNKLQFWKKDFFEAAKPSALAKDGITTFMNKPINWTDKDTDDIRRALIACSIFLYFPIYNLNDGGIGSVSTSQGGTMTSNNIPNDFLNNFNPLVIIIAIPFLSQVFYPYLRRHNIKFGRITRITVGFGFAIASGLVGTLVQWRIYRTSPCGSHATDCAEDDGTVSPVSLWWQLPIYGLSGISECFANVTAYELAYARSPEGMKALVMAVFLFMNALSSALGEIVSPATKDPWLIYIWAVPTACLFVQTIIFWFRYRSVNEEEFMTYEENYQGSKTVEGVEASAFNEKAFYEEEEEGKGDGVEVVKGSAGKDFAV